MSNAKDRHSGKQFRIEQPICGAFAIAPHDVNQLAEVTRSIYVGVAGALKVTLHDGSTITYTNLPVGRHPLRAKLVFATGTTATGLIGEV